MEKNTESESASASKVPQKPVFIESSFDPSNVEHMKGNITITLNKRMATDLCRLLSDCELREDEKHFHALKGHIQRWFNARYNTIKNKFAKQEDVHP